MAMTTTVDVCVNGQRYVSVIIYGDGSVVSSKELDEKAAISIDEVVKQFTNYNYLQGKSSATTEAYAYALKSFRDWLIDSRIGDDLGIITTRHIADWKIHQQTIEKAMPSTINLRLTAVSRLFQWAVLEGIIQINPVVAIKHLSRNRLQPKCLSEQETRKLIDQAVKSGNLRDIAIIELMVSTGLRVAELLVLKFEDIALGEIGGIVTVRNGKGSKFREVPIPARTCEILQMYFNKYDLTLNDKLWCGTRGNLSTTSAIAKILKRLAKAAGIRQISPHTLRHTFAARYLTANPADIRGLAALMGHSNLNTTMIYTEPTQTDLAMRVERAAVVAA